MRIYAVYPVTMCNDLYNCDIKLKILIISIVLLV